MGQVQKIKIPRGIRNNNPLNIRKSPNKWKGKIVPSCDREFEQFVSVEYGLRAAFCILRTYILRYQHSTIRTIIERWAPRSENDTSAYIKTVAQGMGLPPNETLDFFNIKQMTLLLWFMCKVECGEHHGIQFNQFIKAYEMV